MRKNACTCVYVFERNKTTERKEERERERDKVRQGYIEKREGNIVCIVREHLSPLVRRVFFFLYNKAGSVCVRCTIDGGPVCFSYVRTSALKSLGTSVILAWEIEKLYDTFDLRLYIYIFYAFLVFHVFLCIVVFQYGL